jgi:hypothetical protein
LKIALAHPDIRQQAVRVMLPPGRVQMQGMHCDPFLHPVWGLVLLVVGGGSAGGPGARVARPVLLHKGAPADVVRRVARRKAQIVLCKILNRECGLRLALLVAAASHRPEAAVKITPELHSRPR